MDWAGTGGEIRQEDIYRLGGTSWSGGGGGCEGVGEAVRGCGDCSRGVDGHPRYIYTMSSFRQPDTGGYLMTSADMLSLFY